MPKVYTADIRNLLDKAIRAFEKESGLQMSVNYPLFFHGLAAEINRTAHSNLKPETLYKHFYLRLRTFDEVSIGYSWFYLDAISTYCYGKDYRKQFPVLKNTVTDIKDAVRRVDYDRLKGSEDDPRRPEFPPNNPSFPATPTIPIQVDGFRNVWLKDESHNPTGTHKDRMAWEIVLFYRNFLSKIALQGKLAKIPQLSLISSGCAAIAIQTQLRYYNLPSLKVIVDKQVQERIKLAMMKLGCEVFEQDLHQKPLGSAEILEITENPNGQDLTFGQELDHIRAIYYDWLSYEILNQSPDYCIIPFGSGGLFENLLSINKKEIEKAPNHSHRFFGDIDTLKQCHFIGATTSRKDSIMDKLYAPFHPAPGYRLFLEQNILKGICGKDSQIWDVEEAFALEASKIAQQQNINCEASGIAGLAALLQLKYDIPSDKKILIINTGKLKIERFLGG